jgi:multicomponent K+:H+ antiporter subunit E
MKRILPRPRLSLLLLATFVLAQNDASIGVVGLGLLLAVLTPLVTAPLLPEPLARVRLRPLLLLVLRVTIDIVRANVRVAALTLGPMRRLAPGFVVVPLDVKTPAGITVFASVTSLTPGTVSANVSGDRRTLLVHSLEARDAAQAARDLKQRYEVLIREAFECSP